MNTVTRRAKLKAILEQSVAKGITTQDLLDRINSFSQGGGSGLDNFINQTYTELTSVSTAVSSSKVDVVKGHLKAALDALG